MLVMSQTDIQQALAQDTVIVGLLHASVQNLRSQGMTKMFIDGVANDSEHLMQLGKSSVISNALPGLIFYYRLPRVGPVPRCMERRINTIEDLVPGLTNLSPLHVGIAGKCKRSKSPRQRRVSLISRSALACIVFAEILHESSSPPISVLGSTS